MPKVMLIEDDITMLSLLGTLLEMEGFAVAKVTNESSVDELMDTLRRERPDVTLLDVHLRGISGYDLARQLRQDAELKNINVLMASGLDCSEECRQAGANDFILKPFMPDSLIEHIRKLI